MIKMRLINVKTNLKVILIFSCLVFGSCNLYRELMIKTSKAQKISDAVQIGNDWTEIRSSETLRSLAQIHKISVRTDVVETFDEKDPTNQTLKFKTGASGKIEAVLYDEQGNEYQLRVTGIGGDSGGFYLGRERAPRKPNEPPDQEPHFPLDKLYTKLKIRSNVPFEIQKMEWITEIQK